MPHLPITHMTLYKHGVGFFERRAQLSGEAVELTFRVEEMNDVLKSLTTIDWGSGQVLGIEYATPQTREERLAGCSIQLSDTRSLGDLLVGLRGRGVTLRLDQGETATGVMIGVDDAPAEQPLATALVSVLADGSQQVSTFALGRVQGIDILDERGGSDLRFFLSTALSPETHRQVTIRLTPGDHDLSVSYIAPAPTWRVSYRLVLDKEQALLQGWGIFDNRLEEDLNAISLNLVAGMPISFIYDLYTPFTPQRPVVKEPGRVAAGPVEFDQTMLGAAPEAAPMREMSMMAAAPAPAVVRGMRKLNLDQVEAAAPVAASGQDLGELFQYAIQTPVTVGRGQSAMAPIISARLAPQKDLLYNGRKLAKHPVATLRLRNETGLTLERGPATVLDDGEYVGEAVLSFTPVGGEIIVPYAVELGVKIQEDSGSRLEMYGVRIDGAYLRIEQWDVRWYEYRVNNTTAKAQTVVVEHPRPTNHELFDSPAPRETTPDFLRFAIETPARGESKIMVQERRLNFQREEIQKQSYDSLRRYLQRGLIERSTHDRLVELLKLWERVEQQRKARTDILSEREQVYKSQQQIQGNMQALSTTGKEGELRSRYVDDLAAAEARLKDLAKAETAAKAEIERLEKEITDRLSNIAA